MPNSPFHEDRSEWRDIRDDVIEDHPLDMCYIKELVLNSYQKLEMTRVGDPEDNIIIFDDVDVGAQTVGAFLETIIAKELKKEEDGWRQGGEGEKDLVYEPDEKYSIEIKSSGQVGDEVFGNRSYTQGTESEKKSKNGYYITINTHISEDEIEPTNNLFLIRFGWLDFVDWTGQNAQSGQAAKLSDDAYNMKLKAAEGNYMCDAPIDILYGVGEKTIESARDFLDENHIRTVREFMEEYEKSDINSYKEPSKIERIYSSCEDFPEEDGGFRLGWSDPQKTINCS
jgi:hypothetical protein